MSALKIMLLVLPLYVFLLKCSELTTNNNSGCLIPDTTSHNFTWSIDTLGDYGSYLRDVAVISDQEVWAVGLLKLNEKFYSAAIWDGSDWTYKRIEVNGSLLQSQSILAFSPTNIWFAAGSIVHWDGSQAVYEYIRNISSGEFITNLWGTSDGYMVGIGTEGSLVVYDGSQWKRFPNVTNRDLNDVKGIIDPESGKPRVWVAGKTTLLYAPDGEDWQVVWDIDNPLFPDNFINANGLYIPDKCHIIVSVWNGTRARLYRMKQDNPAEYELLTEHSGFAHDMEGQSITDIFMTGSFNVLEHYNGSSIVEYPQFRGGGWNNGMSYSNETIFIAGESGSSFQGIVIRGKRK